MILISGCSFTSEYSDYNTWSTYLTEKIKDVDTVRNVSAGGSSNKLISRRVFWHLNNNFNAKKYDYAIIQWSTIDRWDYPVFVSEDRASDFPRMNMHPERINKINYMSNGTDTFGYGSKFYETYYSLYGAVIDTLENIYHTQVYLKDMNIPYKMITIGNLMQMDVAINNLINVQTKSGNRGDYSMLKTKNILEQLEDFEDSFYEVNIIKELLEKIDFSNFLFTDNNNIGGFGGGIIEWLTDNNESMYENGFHPTLRQSERFFDEFIWPNIKDDVEKNYIKINN
jgi:hypothetical protein